MKTAQALLLFFFAISCTSPNSPTPPLMDGKIGEYEQLGVTPINISDSVDLYIYQDAHYVWLAYSYPSGSYGTMDMVISTEKIKEPLNLHISAQLGEWPADDPEAAPQDPQSDKWWNITGWYANEIWLNGMDRSGETAEINFKNAPAREMQLSKARFGRGEWKISMEIRAINSSDGFVTLKFPETEVPYSLMAD